MTPHIDQHNVRNSQSKQRTLLLKGRVILSPLSSISSFQIHYKGAWLNVLSLRQPYTFGSLRPSFESIHLPKIGAEKMIQKCTLPTTLWAHY
uniref:Uncharacterized protein n=1 Tax=Arundo donax TaxID=35708 RepID=A0A0A9CFT0_ARUDO